LKNINSNQHEVVRSLLKKHWGYDSLRPHQEGPIASLITGHHMAAVIPTGGGKSMCYQLPGLVRGGLTVVVSPLIALMRDQVDDLKQRGIRAFSLGGVSNKRQFDQVLDSIERLPSAFLFISPERVNHPDVVARMDNWDVRTIAIDEAHCISEWGHDFRPQYRSLHRFLPRFKNAVCGCFTGTATPDVAKDIVDSLGLKDVHSYRFSPRRPNLEYGICDVRDPDAQLLRAVNESAGSGLVYVPTRFEAEVWARRLQGVRGGVAAYHAGLDLKLREERQRKWVSNEIRVVVCTSAFGMGIDKPDVRWVYHPFLPENLETYVQQAGRAGRDGARSQCILFLNDAKIQESQERIERKAPQLDLIRSLYQFVANQGEVAIGECPDDSIRFSLESWAAKAGIRTSQAKESLSFLERAGYFDAVQSSIGTTYDIRLNPSALPALQNDDTMWSKFLLKSARQGKASWTLRDFQYWHVQATQAEAVLKTFQSRGWIRYDVIPGKVSVKWARPREVTSNVFIPDREGRIAQEYRVQRGEKIALFVSETPCRQQFIEGYFGFPDSNPCGVCDRCKLANIDRVKSDWLKEIPREGLHWESWLSSKPIGELPLFIAAMKLAYVDGEVRMEDGRIYQTSC